MKRWISIISIYLIALYQVLSSFYITAAINTQADYEISNLSAGSVIVVQNRKIEDFETEVFLLRNIILSPIKLEEKPKVVDGEKRTTSFGNRLKKLAGTVLLGRK
ncbi:hypothetical protein FG877_17150 [Enterococcus casseliflavus]|nr:hypothetical protein [Enterococcus casseliflavus]